MYNHLAKFSVCLAKLRFRPLSSHSPKLGSTVSRDMHVIAPLEHNARR